MSDLNKSGKKPLRLEYVNVKTGEVEIYDPKTGELLESVSYKERGLLPYTKALGSVVCNFVREGKTLSDIAKKEGMPSSTMVYTWRRIYPEFKAEFDAAREDRSHYFNDMAISELEQVRDVGVLTLEEHRCSKLVIDTAMKLAEKDGPKEYVPNSNNNINFDNKVQVVITGVPEKNKEMDSYGEAVFEQEQ